MRQAKARAVKMRASLMLSTALQAVAMAVAATPAFAQLAANTRPGGGQVTAGNASIGGNATTTLIKQTSEKAAINWQTYNVGSAQTVRYAQPNAAAVTLNTVLSANPSLIAGKILANGQIIIVNQSGVVFAKGSQVDTAGLVVSSAGISQKDFMAGRMVFSQAGHPGALISNAGNITVRQAGLAALVAPQVANSGTITANLGRVILAGATTHTLDLYGDGLVALNVTGQVTQVSLDGKLVPALVTNTGTILAPGGTVVLTASAADGVVTNLVSAGGTIAAPSAGAQTGRVLVQGIGGGITIDGQVSATGLATGTKGGQVEVNATGAVNVASTAVIDASGDSGGGIVSVGTTAARAIGGASVHPTLTSQSVNIAAGARIRANATRAGQGGRIAVLSRNVTTQAGTVTATGGPISGSGGWVEVSGNGLALGGKTDASAQHGKAGTILLDPFDMILGGTGTSNATTLDVTQSELNQLNGNNVILRADGTLSVSSKITFGGGVSFLQLEGDDALVIDAPVVAPSAAVGLKSASGSISENASGSITASSISATAATSIDLAGQNTSTTIASFNNTSTTLTLTGIVPRFNPDLGRLEPDFSPPGTLAFSAPGLTAATTINIDITPPSGSSTLTIDGGIAAGTLSAGGTYSGSTSLNVSTGNIVENQGASIRTGTLSSGGSATGGSANFDISAGNTIATLTNFTSAGAFALENDTALTIGTLASNAGGVTLTAPGIALNGTLTSGTLASAPSNGGTPYTGLAILDATAGNIVESSGASLRAGTLTGEALSTATSLTTASGNATFTNTSVANTIANLSGFTADGNFTLEDESGLTVGPLSSQFGALAISGPATGSPSGSLILAGNITAATAIDFSNAKGISIGGTLSTGAVPTNRGIFYSGSVTLDASSGNIGETGSGAIYTGTLSGEALSAASSLVTTAGNATFTATSGNTISTLTNFTTAGNFALENDTALTIGTLASSLGGIAVTGPSATVTSPGSLTVAGPVSAATSISLSNALGITLSGTLTAGTLVSAAATYTGFAILDVAGGNIAETNTASIRAGTLSGEALSTATSLVAGSGNATFTTTAGNTISTLTGFTADGNVALEDDSGLTVGALASRSGSLAIAGPASGSPSGSLILAGTITAGTSISFSNALGISELAASSLTGSSSTGTAIALTSSDGIALAGTTTAGTLSAGAYTGLASFNVTNGNIVEASAGSIRAATLGGEALSTATSLVAGSGNATFTTTAGNTISTLTGFTADGNVALEDESGLTVGALSSRSGSLAIAGPASGSPSGSLILAGTITAGTSISFSNALGISELAASSLTGSSSTGTAIALTSSDGITLAGTTTAGTLLAGVYTGLANLDVTSGNIVETSTASIRAGTLAGEALSTATSLVTPSGNATLTTTAGNTISTLTGFTADGNFTLEDDAGLTVGALSSNFGSLAIAGPATGSPSGSLNLAGTITAATSIDFSNALGIGISGTLSAGTVFVNGPSVYLGAVTLDASNGNIVENSTGSIRARTLSGEALSTATSLVAASGNATFTTTAGNTISTLTGFTADGYFTLEDESGLTVGNLASAFGSLAIAGPASGSPAGSLTLAGTITAGTSISFSNALGISELAGASLTGSSSTGTAIALDSATFITLAGTTTAGTANNGTYSGLADFAVTGGNIDESAGILRAGTLSGEALSTATSLVAGSGNATFATSAGNTISTLTNFIAAGNFTLEDNAGLTIGSLASTFGSLAIAGPATGNPANILILAGDITADTSISFSNSLGIAEFSGASVTSTNSALSLSTGGSLTQGTSSSLTGDSSTGTALALNAGTGITLSGTLTAGTLASNGTLYSGLAALTVTGGNIDETTSGALRAGTLAAAAANGATAGAGNISLDGESSATTGNQIANLAASSAGGAFNLSDGQSLTITGAVLAGLTRTIPSQLAIIAPAISETAGGSLAISPPNTTSPGVLTLVADQFSILPGGVQNQGGIVALDLLNTTIFAINTQPGATISPASLQNIQAGTGTIAIGSLGGTLASPANASSTGWTIGTGGTVSLIDITAPFDLKTGGAAETLGLFSNGSITSSAGFTVTTLYGLSANGTAAITGANAISTLAAFSTAATPANPSNATAFQLTDIVPLTVLGPVSAGQGAVDIAVSQSNGLTLGALGGGSGNITGTDIDLSAAGSISQLSGTLDATGASNAIAADSTPGSIVLQSSGSGIGLGSTQKAALTAPSAHGVILLYAGGGDITENAAESLAGGTLAAQATGNIQLSSTTNAISVIAPLTTVVNGTLTTLSGLVASGTTGIAFTNATPLIVNDGAVISAFGPAGTTGPGTGTISLTAGGLTLGTSTGATIAAPGNVTLDSTGTIAQTGGLALSDANIDLAAQSGITLAGTLTAGTLPPGGTYTGVATFAVTSGNIAESGGIIRAGTLTSGGATIGGSANFAPSTGNTISTLTNLAATGNVALEDDTALTIGTLASTAGAVTITGPSTAVASPGTLAITGPVSAGTTISLTNAIGITLAGTLTAGTLAAGAYSGRAVFDVIDGNIAETDTASIRAGTLGGEALSTATSLVANSGNATFTTTAGNTISTLTGFTAAGNFALEDTAGLTIGALSSTFGSLAIAGPASGNPAGILTLAGDITAATSINFSNSLGISELGGAAVTASSAILSTGGTFTQAANASLTGSSSTGTALSLTAGTGITLAGTTTAGTLNAGTYTGFAIIDVTNGNISESRGSLRAGTLSGAALSSATSLVATSGNATFTSSAGNTIGTLTNFTAAGNFALEDSAGLTVGALSSTFGSLAIAGPATGNPTGILTLAGDITAATSFSFSNSQGISEQAGASITGTSGVLSTSGSIIQAATSTLTGSSSTGTALALTASTGITLAGTTTAGTLAGANYTGLAVIDVTGGNIAEASGILRAGTLSGEALSSATSLVAASGNANFASPAGNTIGTLTNVTAAGNFALEDNSGLTVGALSSTFGSLAIAGPAIGNPTNILTLAGPITAGTSITFSNALGISERAGAGVTAASSLSLSSGGSIAQAGTSSLTGATVALTAGTGLTLAGTTTAGTLSGGTYTGLAVFDVTDGNIAETNTASIRAGTLGGEALSTATSLVANSGNATFTTAAGNTITTLTGFTAAGNFALEDSSGLTVGALSSTFGSLAIAGPASGNPAGILTLAGDITAATSINFSNSLGISELGGAAVTASSAILSTGGTFTQAANASLTGSSSSSTGTALALTAGTGITLAGTTTAGTLNAGAYTGFALIDVANGNISESRGSLRAGTLSGAALSSATSLVATSGNANFTSSAGNTIGTLTGFTAAGNFALEDSAGLTVGALSSTFGSLAIAGPTTGNPTGILTLAGDITAATSFNFSNSQGISERAGASITGTSGLLSTSGSIIQAATSTLTGSSSTGTALALTASSGITLAGTTSAGTLTAGGTYTGLATFNAASGNIDENSGVLRAATLTSSGATIGGNASFAPSAGNTISTLTNFVTARNFALEDDAGLNIGTLEAGGSISITGPTGPSANAPTGILIISSAISAGANLSLSNALGIAERASGSVTSTGGSTALTSSRGAIAQQAGGTMFGADGLALTAGGSTSFSTALPNQRFGTVNGIAFGGTLAAPAGTLALSASQGNISETGPGQTTSTGTLQASLLSAIAQTGTLAGQGLVILDTPSATNTGNQVSGLGAVSSDGLFALSDGTGLTVSGTVQDGLRATKPTALQIIATAIDVTTGSLAIVPPNGTKPGILSLVANAFSFANAGAVSTQGGIVSLDLLNPGTNGNIFAIGPAATVTAASLANIRTNGGTLAIGSLDGTNVSPGTTNLAGWTVGQAGTVDQIAIAAGQTVFLNNTAATLGLFTNATTGNTNGVADLGGISVASLYGIANGIFAEGLDTSNAIGTLGIATPSGTLFGFSTTQAPSKAIAFDFTDGISLDVLGPITATTGGIEISVTGSTSGIANSLTLGGTITRNGAQVLTGGNLTGSDVFLSAAGDIVQSTGIIDATGATATLPSNNTNGTVALAAGGAIDLQSTVQAGTSSGALLLSATTGDISESAATTLSAGTLAASAGGDILLATGTNTIGVISPLATAVLGQSLAGLTAEGATGIDFTDRIALTIADGALVSAFGPDGITGPGTGPNTGSVTISLTTGDLTLGVATGATIAAPADITLTAPGSILQTGGLIDANGAISLAAGSPNATGNISQSGGTITAGQDVSLVSATGSFTQANASITGSTAVTLDFLENITQSAGSTIAAPGSTGTIVLASAAGSISQNGLLDATGAVLLSAGAGDIVQAIGGSIDAGTLAAAATGNITLPGNNQVSSIGSLGATLAGALPQTLTLYGLTAAGASGITFTDISPLGALQIGPDTANHAVIDATGAAATLTINMDGLASVAGTTTYGSLVLGDAGASSLLAGGAITIHSLGSILQVAGTIRSAAGSVTLGSIDGSFLQSGSTIKATSVTINTGLDVGQTGGTITSLSGSIGIDANGSVSQSASSLIDAATSVSITAGLGATLAQPTLAGGNISQSDSTISAGTNVTLVADATSPAFGNISQSAASTIAAGQVASLTSLQGSFTQNTSAIFGPAGVTVSVHGDVVSTGSQILSSGTSSPAHPGAVSITSTNGAISSTQGSSIEADGPAATVLLSAAGDILAGEINTGTLAATAGGNLVLNGTNRISDIAAIASFPGLTATTGDISLSDLLPLTVQPGATIQALAQTGTISIAAATLTLDSATIEAGSTIALSATGSLSQSGGLIQSNQDSIGLTGQSFAQTGGGAIVAAQTIAIDSTTGLLIDGSTLQAGAAANGIYTGALSLSAGAAGINAATGTLLTGTLAAFSAGPVTLSAAANEIAVIGTAGSLTGLAATGPIILQDAQSLTVAAPLSATGPAASIDVTVSSGAFTDAAGIGITTPGAVSISAAQAVAIAGPLGSGTLNIQAGGAFTEFSGASITAKGTSSISSGQSVDIDGTLDISGASHISAATNLTEGPSGLIIIPAPATLTAPGSITLDGVVKIPGLLDIAAGANVLEGATASISSGNTTIDAAAGTATISGILQTSSLAIAAGAGIDETQAASITAGGPTQFTVAGATVISGALTTSGPLTINAGTVTVAGQLSAAGLLEVTARDGISIPGTVADGGTTLSSSGGPVSIAGSLISANAGITAGTFIDLSGKLDAAATTLAAGGTIDIGGSLNATGALDLKAGSDLAEGPSATITADSTASLLAPGTITLAGLLSAPTIRLGTPSSAIVWDGNTIRTNQNADLHGATNAINRLSPLTMGQGIFVTAASLQQIGTTFVDPLTGGAATLQITVQGKGTAHFDNLVAPDAQLLLSLENGGFANGLIDVSGLNVFFTQGETPSQAVDLLGVVGGRGGTAAAAAGFAHLSSNINYQVNGCPIESINCILLSPVVVPVVNPVNDFAEGTQRKRHQDDDALPNVGEEDY